MLRAQLEQLGAASKAAEEQLRDEQERRFQEYTAQCDARLQEAAQREVMERSSRQLAEANESNLQAEVRCGWGESRS